MLRRLLVALMVLAIAAPVRAAEPKLTIDTSAARAVLDALETPALDHARALAVARMPGNQGLIRKAKNYGRPADDESLATALMAAAHHDDAAPDPSRFGFQHVRANITQLRRVLDDLENPATGRIATAKARITAYAPPGVDAPITGYLVVGGTSGGFAFGDPEFFLNLNYFPDAVLATTIMEHELYHAVQGAAAIDKARKAAVTKCLARVSAPPNIDDLFASLMAEGTAASVGDVLALPADATGPVAETRGKFARNVSLVARSVTLLELSSHALATRAVAYDDIYPLGFYGDEILYSLGYLMAKAIEHEQGAGAIGALIRDPTGAAFINAYAGLKSYGKSDDVPALGPKTLALAKRMAVCAVK